MHWCPGCEQPHGIYVEQGHPHTGARWTFDGNTEHPTFAPSIRCYHRAGKWINDEWVEHGPEVTTCHYHLQGGMLNYCADSVHALSGQSVPLPLYPESWSHG